jgi:glyoxylase-like metal-dependent hydrolase (beta-lactamase superfamily II)
MSIWVHEDDTLRVAKFSVGDYDNNVYIVVSRATDEAVIVDAAAEPDRILAAAAGLDVRAILTTHGHFDHLQALDPVKEALGVAWHLHPADIDIAGRPPDEVLSDGQEYVVGDVALHVVHTPGHTPGSVSFVVEPIIFSGDTLFPGGPGATRWDYSSFGQVMDSIEQRLMVHPDPTIVHPGHGGSTTLGDERPHLAEWRTRGW